MDDAIMKVAEKIAGKYQPNTRPNTEAQNGETPPSQLARLQTEWAQMNGCLTARKCNLVPFHESPTKENKTKESESKNSQKRKRPETNLEDDGPTTHNDETSKSQFGCCEDQTGHHIIPDATMADANCLNYIYEQAPTVCVEGATIGHGSHGVIHNNWDIGVNARKGLASAPPIPASLSDLIEMAIASHRASFSSSECNDECLRAQLNEYFLKACNNGTANTTRLTPKLSRSNNTQR